MRAARDARTELSAAVATLHRSEAVMGSAAGEELDQIEEGVARVVRRLFAAETASPDGIVQVLEAAMEMLRELLERLQDDEETPLTRVTESVARTLAVLYPAMRELERSISTREDDAEPALPIPLTRKREPDRRTAARLRIEAAIGLSSQTNFYTGRGNDLSGGGLFVATHDVLPVGTELVVSFVLPGGHQVVTAGHVSWVRAPKSDDSDPGMGIAFERLSAADFEAIAAFTQAREPLFHEH